jgi:Na+-translocating ferredoxin:NAD+ oxidoreductase RnfC subunit
MEMRMIVWSYGTELKRVWNGKRVSLKCSSCDRQATFYESTADESFKVFLVVDLYKKTRRVMQCGECQGVCDYFEMFPHEKEAFEAAQAKAAKEAHDRQKAEEQRKREATERELKRQEEEAHKRREQEQKRKDQEVNSELEALKKKLGK